MALRRRGTSTGSHPRSLTGQGPAQQFELHTLRLAAEDLAGIQKLEAHRSAVGAEVHDDTGRDLLRTGHRDRPEANIGRIDFWVVFEFHRSVSLRTITRLEVGGRAGLDTVRQLADALKVKPADLLRPPPAN